AGPPRRVRRPRSRLPHARPRRAPRGARARGLLRDVAAVGGRRRGGRDAVRSRAGVPGVPDARAAAEAVRGGGAGGAHDARARRGGPPGRRRERHPHPRTGAGGRDGLCAAGLARAPRLPARRAGAPAVLDRGAAAPDGRRRAVLALDGADRARRPGAGAARVQRLPRAPRPAAAALRPHGALAGPDAGRDAPPARVPARLARLAAGGRSAHV
ncbi:MAG: hypothetical protein AVDCRST_MAG30-321, partial [uncultured Solirubrobacteraceae bacterium]